MATLRDIKRRIKGVKNTQQITKAMKMVAAAKLRRAQDAIINARPYANKISYLIRNLISEEDKGANPFIFQREIKNILLVVVTADRGLCGAFNTNIIREANRFVQKGKEENSSVKYKLYCVGRKGADTLNYLGHNVVEKNIGLFSSLKYKSALEITDRIITGYLEGNYDKVFVLYNEFKSVVQQKILMEQLLPVPVEAESDLQKNIAGDNKSHLSKTNFIFEPDQKYVFDNLLPKHLKAQMWRVLLESNAAEFGARMTAMESATENAKELIRTLTIKFNKERQASITKEILEIVSGANALKAST